MRLRITEAAGLLEIVASERPDLLGPLVETLRSGPDLEAILDLARDWHVEPAEVASVAAKTARQLSRLEARRGQWRHPSQIVDGPNLSALARFAVSRKARVSGMPRSQRLHVLCIKLHRLADLERQRRQLDTFLQEPGTPVSPVWLENFLRRPRTI